MNENDSQPKRNSRQTAVLAAVMREEMKNKDIDDYKVIFGAATISKKEATRLE